MSLNRTWAVAVVAAIAVVGLGAHAVSNATNGCRGRDRTYYIAADEVAWNYAPDGFNRITEAPFSAEEQTWTMPGKDRLGSTYTKALYREYTDANFTSLKPRGPEWQHLGLLGPAIQAEVGDTIKVVFRNNVGFPVSMHPHGLLYDKSSEGAAYGAAAADPEGAGIVPPDGTTTYTWRVAERAGPAGGDGSSAVWMYHSHKAEPADANAGLVGPIIVTRCGMANPDGSPRDVDRQFVALFMVVDENASPLLAQNAAKAGIDASNAPEEFAEGNLKHSINGYLFGNMPGLTMQSGERVRWYVLGLGNEVDLHTPHWHGQAFTEGGMRVDSTELLPGSMRVLDMTADNPGEWLLHCHVHDHIRAGMMALFQVQGGEPAQVTTSNRPSQPSSASQASGLVPGVVAETL